MNIMVLSPRMIGDRFSPGFDGILSNCNALRMKQSFKQSFFTNDVDACFTLPQLKKNLSDWTDRIIAVQCVRT